MADQPNQRTATSKQIWAVGNLRGRARGYRRATLTLPGVTGAVRQALMHDVTLDAIQAVLAQEGLRWDPAVNEVVDDAITR